MTKHESRDEHRMQMFHRIHQIQEKLVVLERDVQADEDIEHLVVGAMAIENLVDSLILHMLTGYLEHHIRTMLQQDVLQLDIDAVLNDAKRMLELAYQPSRNLNSIDEAN